MPLAVTLLASGHSGVAVRADRDLQALLIEIRAQIPYAPPLAKLRISWVDPQQLHPDTKYWAMWHRLGPDEHWIGVNAVLRDHKAPLYVLRCLIRHELLHAVFPPRRGAKRLHPKAHVVAERLGAGRDWARFNAWLDRQ